MEIGGRDVFFSCNNGPKTSHSACSWLLRQWPDGVFDVQIDEANDIWKTLDLSDIDFESCSYILFWKKSYSEEFKQNPQFDCVVNVIWSLRLITLVFDHASDSGKKMANDFISFALNPIFGE